MTQIDNGSRNVEDMMFGRRYRVTERIGSGGMAEVYKAQDEVLGRTVAVKVLHARYATEPNFVARFRQEAQAAANLQHPNIVNIYDWGREDETYFIVMEFVKGTDLKAIVQQQGPLDPIRAAEYAVQVCSALAEAHGYDVIHRDIKPHNIVITPDGAVKVMDFGIARAGNTSMTQTGSVLGTAQYISPEQAQGRPLGPSSDLYSLGVTLYELVTGRLPFDADTPVAVALKQVNEQPVPVRQVRPSVPASLEAVIMRALRKDPSERYISAKEMRTDLKRVVSGEALNAPAAYAPRQVDETSVMPAMERADHVRTASNIRPVPERRVSPWVWVAVAALVLVLGIGTALALNALGNGQIVTPPLVGLTEEQAIIELKSAELELGEVTTQNDPSVELGKIISQDPESGTKVEKGTAVDIVVSAGIEQVEMPDLTEMPEGDAIDALKELGLVYERSADEYNTELAEGIVIRTEPEALTMVPKGQRVVLYVSRGTEKVQVPDVTGKTLADATKDLQAADFKVTSTEEFSDTVPKGQVISQTPDPAVYVDAGSTVKLVISKGVDIVIVPDVTGMTEAAARAELTSKGLEAKVEYEDSLEHGLVIDQDPIPNASARRNDTVTITVGIDPNL
ncbi:MAG: Stk1 family PASTA domain-containing Ser/Thr kinase [Coriobacteriia bacterium]|nr:Stk1 family PASTA domain-containing Ser/Thr kinase [Coriobacteriia bacterium]